jgi:hypothetical protein
LINCDELSKSTYPAISWTREDSISNLELSDLFADFDGLNGKRRASRFQDPERGTHNLRTNAVAMGDCNRNFRSHRVDYPR